MATGAGEALTWHGGVPTAHELDGFAFGVERLYGDGSVGGHLEAGRPVRFDGHGAHDAVNVPRAVDADIDMTAHAVVAEVRFVEAEIFDGAAGHSLESGALIDIRQIDGGILLGEVDAIGDDRRAEGLVKGYRL